MSVAHSRPALAISSHLHFKASGSGSNENLGQAASRAGDFNGDGYADIIAGAPGHDGDGADAGRAYIHFGGPIGDAVPDLTLNGPLAGAAFGTSVACAGDFNGDGLEDVIVGAPYFNTFAGSAYLYYGGRTPNASPDVTFFALSASEQFGYSVGGAGDVNGDGYDDVIIGAPRNSVGLAEAGRAYVFYGGSSPNTVADLTFMGAAASDRFGLAVAGVGDMDGDGFDDCVVGGLYSDAAYVFTGYSTPTTSPALTIMAPVVNEDFGSSVGPAGDINGDGFDDVLIGAPSGGNEGQAFVVYGGATLNAVIDLTLAGFESGQRFGDAVGGAGDVNGDGYDDFVIGASAGGGDGRAYVYLGGSSPNTTVDLTLVGAAVSGLGTAVNGAGDVNGDGYGDLVIGSSFDDPPFNAGSVSVFLVYPYMVLSPNGREQWVAGEPARIRWRGHEPADVAVSFDGGATWNTLLSSVGGQDDNELTITAPWTATEGARLRVSVTGQTVRNSTSDLSDGVFRIVLPAVPPAVASRRDLLLAGAGNTDDFGYSVDSAGDFNGDGFDDVIVGARFYSTPNNGRAYLYFGGPVPDLVPDLVFDGLAASDFFGSAVGSAGDMNGDGFSDVIIGAFGNDAGGSQAGAAYVYFGGTTPNAVVDLTLLPLEPGQFGISVGTAGDVNGDGFSDVIVGANLSDAAGADAGAAYVFLGGNVPNAGVDLWLNGVEPGDDFGVSVGTAGDFNGDGFSDFIVGADLNDKGGDAAGRAYLYFGGRTPNNTPDLYLTGTNPGDQLGIAVGTAGDVNGDGFGDVIVGAFSNDAAGANAGSAYVFLGGPSPDNSPDLTLTGAAAGDQFGYSVGTAGDANRDGYADFVVGAPFHAAGGANAGRAYVFFGGPAPDQTADVLITGVAGDQMGISARGAGDMNSDGFADLIVGANRGDGPVTDAGTASIHLFRRYLMLAPSGAVTWNVGSSQTVSWLGATPADLSLSVDGGRSYEVLRSGVGGSDRNEVSLVVPHAPTRFARLRLTPAQSSTYGTGESSVFFTIQSSIALLAFTARPVEEGIELTWSSEPAIGPQGIAGYRLLRSGPGSATWAAIGPERILEMRYLDRQAPAGSRYRLLAVNGLGEEIELGATHLPPAAPLAAWPLPYRGGHLQVSFSVPGDAAGAPVPTELALFDLSGRRVRTLVRGAFPATLRSASWDGRDDAGAPVRPGLYFLSVRAGDVHHEVKVVVAR